jgi:hypothetical protein
MKAGAMKAFAIAAAAASAIAGAAAGAGQNAVIRGAAVQVDFTDDQLNPSHWTLTLHSDGAGHFASQMGKAPEGDEAIDAANIDRDVQLSAAFTAHVFDVAHRHNLFNEGCESRLKVAFEGWKKFSYTGPEGSGTCTFNYSKDKEIEDLAESFGAVAQTIIEGARLEKLLQHDRLGLDKEMEYLVDAAGSGRAQEISTIRQILVRLADDDEVLERVRKRARLLLAQAGT